MGFKCRGVYIRRLLEMTILFLNFLIFDSEILIFLLFLIGLDLDWIGFGLVWFGFGFGLVLGREDKGGWIWDDNFLMK